MADRAAEWPRHWDTFLDTPPDEAGPDSARAVLIPVPYDATTSYLSGARYGPKAIIAASRHMEDYDLELDRDISEVGIYTAPELSPDAGGPESMVRRVEEAVSGAYAPGRLIGLLGGEHSITVGAVRALRRAHPELSVLYLDAHADLRDEYMGTRWGHASVARRLRELCPVVQVGVRSASEEEVVLIRESDLPVFFWPGNPPGPPSATGRSKVRSLRWAPDIDELTAAALDRLSPQVYISIDLDVFDPSLMSAVGTPEPGGMAWEDVTRLLKGVCERRDIVGFDVTELSPREGPEACAFTAARLTYKLIGYATASP